MKKFKQTEGTVNAVGMILFFIVGFLTGVALDPAFKFNPDNWRAVVLGFTTAFIGWIAMTIQNENRKIAHKKLLLDGYKEKEIIEKVLTEKINKFTSKFLEIEKWHPLSFGDKVSGQHYRVDCAHEMLVLINEIEKAYCKYDFLLSLMKVNFEPLIKIFEILKLEQHKNLLSTYLTSASNIIPESNYKKISFINTGLQRIAKEINNINLKFED